MNKLEIKKAREILGLTQTAFGKLLGVGLRAVQSWESGERNMSETTELLLKQKLSEHSSYNKYDQPEINHVVNEETIETKEELRAHFEKLLNKVNKTIEKLEKEASGIDALKELKEFIILKNDIQKELDGL